MLNTKDSCCTSQLKYKSNNVKKPLVISKIKE